MKQEERKAFAEAYANHWVIVNVEVAA